jgi:hypothetical protein
MFSARKKDQRTYKGFKYWPTEKLKGVIDDDFCRGVNGADYEPFIDEIRNIYFERLNKINEIEFNREIQARG